jgi:hypothetical protein
MKHDSLLHSEQLSDVMALPVEQSLLSPACFGESGVVHRSKLSHAGYTVTSVEMSRVWCCAAMAHTHAARDRRGGEPPPRRGGHEDDGAGEGTPGDEPGDGGTARGGGRGRGAGGNAAYLQDVRSAASQMRRPSGSLSWR